MPAMKVTQHTKAIGGYFELELPRHAEYHADGLALNSGRFCLEYLLMCRAYSKIYLPYFTCDTVLDAIVKLDIPYEYYHIDKSYRIVGEVALGEGEALIYTNYWGLQTEYCQELSRVYGKHLILDYTQSFYAEPIEGIDTFYSCRKFFGVPDGGYLYTDADCNELPDEDVSFDRVESLLKRIDLSPEEGYADFRSVSESFKGMPVRIMSKLTKRMMAGIDYEDVARRRRANYEFLRAELGGRTLLEGEVPMIFPYEAEDGSMLRRRLIENRIYVAKYWPNVAEWVDAESIEVWIMENIIPLPIDQRYSEEEMMKIIRVVTNE